MVYFDNAATTFPKPKEVTAAVAECLRNYAGNPGRGTHKLALRASEAVYDARTAVASFFGYDRPERVIFTQSATYALNLSIKTSLPDGCRVLISDLEHNALVRPLFAYARGHGITVDTFHTKGDIAQNIREKLTDETFGILSTLRSNVTGRQIPLSVLSEIAKERGLFLLVDASQSAGHDEIDLRKTPCDVLCAPGHKGLFGVQGCGFAIFSGKIPKKTFIEGGSGVFSISEEMPDSLPERLEAGTLPLPAIVGLQAGISYVGRIGLTKIREKTARLTEEAKKILADLPGLSYLSGDGGIVSFRLRGQSPDETAELLDRSDIAVRSGLHCAPTAHRTEGTEDGGTVRLGFSCLNSETQLDRFAKAIRKIAKHTV